MAKRTQEKDYARPVAGVASAAREALAAVGSVREGDSGHIEGTIGPSIWSWGENVRIDVAAAGEGARVTVESSSRVPFQFVDWGKNSRNVRRIIEQIDEKLA